MLTVKTNSVAVDPNNQLEFLEKDYAIIRGATIGLVDFSHPDTFSGADYTGINIPGGTAVKGLTNDAVDGAIPLEIPNGFSEGILTLSASTYVSLPSANFKPPVDGSVDRAVHCFWISVPKTGYPNSTNNNVIVLGDDSTTSNNYGRLSGQFDMSTDDASLLKLDWIFYGSSISVPSTAIDALAEGIHQVAFTFEVVDSETATVRMYLDNQLVATRTSTYNDIPNQGGSNFVLGDGEAFNEFANDGLKFGRINIADLTNRPDISITDYIARDWEHAKGFFGL